MIKDIRIRTAGSADVEAISQLLRSCGLLGNNIDPSSHLYSLAVLGGKVIGCACGQMHGETVIIQTVAVQVEYRGHQVATHLVRDNLDARPRQRLHQSCGAHVRASRVLCSLRVHAHRVGRHATEDEPVQGIPSTLWHDDTLHVSSSRLASKDIIEYYCAGEQPRWLPTEPPGS
ncbi:GNAT family N-acetyltransferase [Cupriavidus basilensis]